MASKSSTLPTIENRKARHLFTIFETYEVGVVLRGTEVKSIRQGNFNINEAYVFVRNGEIFLVNAYIDEYDKGNINNHLPRRERKLLAHRKEIEEMQHAVQRKGMTLVPLKAYFKESHFKIFMGIGKGKAEYDKRQDKAKAETQREITRALHARNKGM